MTFRRGALFGSVVLAASAAGFVAGVLVRPAQAQSLTTATIYVPPGGLVFRTLDGAPIARLSADAHGGNFELLDDHFAARPVEGSQLRPNPYSVDERDPWTKPAARERRPAAGF